MLAILGKSVDNYLEFMIGETIIESIDERNLGARALLGAAVATIALAASCEQANAISASSQISNANGKISQRLSFSPNTGEATCRVSQETYDGDVFGSQTLLMRAEEHKKDEWAPIPFFKQPFEVSEPDDDPNKVRTRLTTQYNAKALGRIAQKRPVRLACLSGQTSIKLALPKQIFPKK